MNPFDDTQDDIPVVRADYGSAPPPAGKQQRKSWRRAHLGDAALWGLVAAAVAVIIAGAVVIAPDARHEVASVVHRHGGHSKASSPPQVTPATRVPFAARVVAGPSPSKVVTPAVTLKPSKVTASAPAPSARPSSPGPAPVTASPATASATTTPTSPPPSLNTTSSPATSSPSPSPSPATVSASASASAGPGPTASPTLTPPATSPGSLPPVRRDHRSPPLAFVQ